MHDDSGSSGGWIDTWSGRRFYPLNPKPGDIDIGDIASSLSHQCRFGGHTRVYYSVAQHSLRVSELLLDEGLGPEVALWGLLHDAAEAYILDLPRPIKRVPAMFAYRRSEDGILRAVAEKFSLPMAIPPAVRAADERLLATEIRDLMNSRMKPLDAVVMPLQQATIAIAPDAAREQFLAMFWRLQVARGAQDEDSWFPVCPLLAH